MEPRPNEWQSCCPENLSLSLALPNEGVSAIKMKYIGAKTIVSGQKPKYGHSSITSSPSCYPEDHKEKATIGKQHFPQSPLEAP
ncbi:hypothetical protein TNCV_1151961 [Trichonephila clavipes]|nr:hypothetical protein TNCV_1151961 [Trichonephila clavipes]